MWCKISDSYLWSRKWCKISLLWWPPHAMGKAWGQTKHGSQPNGSMGLWFDHFLASLSTFQNLDLAIGTQFAAICKLVVPFWHVVIWAYFFSMLVVSCSKAIAFKFKLAATHMEKPSFKSTKWNKMVSKDVSKSHQSGMCLMQRHVGTIQHHIIIAVLVFRSLVQWVAVVVAITSVISSSV